VDGLDRISRSLIQMMHGIPGLADFANQARAVTGGMTTD